MASKKPILSAGDILCALDEAGGRYGVYIDDAHVIHYGQQSQRRFSVACVHETTLRGFLGGADTLQLCIITEDRDWAPPDRGTPFSRRPDLLSVLFAATFDRQSFESYRRFSPEDTVRRAREAVGETRYTLTTYRCEYFALWCKANISIPEHLRIHRRDVDIEAYLCRAATSPPSQSPECP